MKRTDILMIYLSVKEGRERVCVCVGVWFVSMERVCRIVLQWVLPYCRIVYVSLGENGKK